MRERGGKKVWIWGMESEAPGGKDSEPMVLEFAKVFVRQVAGRGRKDISRQKELT